MSAEQIHNDKEIKDKGITTQYSEAGQNISK